MNALVVLAIVSVLGVAALFLALALFLSAIARELEEIGGPVSYLAKIRLGLRAIERHTDALVPHLTGLNRGLGAIRDGLKAVDPNLAGLVTAVSRQARS